ncbi:hypothetical protein QUV83_08295 [Cellulomonas cellasea]|uniref:SGNH/GDSL hydrolase family protein n=1 Tax=Cellulomonas cellasea TaxID=43670 RepID=UPI0025A36E6A|nr:hypothetical protein [Cellulomonas cellasea]MDM8084760.1 hypothetical protein [Cellulomonas cellasea]
MTVDVSDFGTFWKNYDPKTGVGDPSTPVAAPTLNEREAKYAALHGAMVGYVNAARDYAEQAAAPADDQVAGLVGAAGTATRAQLDARYATDADVADLDGLTPQPISAVLQRSLGKVIHGKDSAATTVRVYGIGSSVMVGGGVTDYGTDGPLPLLVAQLNAAFAPVGPVSFVGYNDGQDGSAAGDWRARYTAWVTANGVPDVVYVVAGMNDFAPAVWHKGQTFDANPGQSGFVTLFEELLSRWRADGCDIIVATTPHMHTGRVPNGGGLTTAEQVGITYPDATYTPNGSPGNEHIRSLTLPDGRTVPYLYRFRRGNQAIRLLAAKYGALLLDAERTYFDAVATYGEDALYNTGQYNHPNTFGIARSYGDAGRIIRKSLRDTATVSPRPTTTVFDPIRKVKATNANRTTSTLATDPQLSVTAPVRSKWLVKGSLYFTGPADGDVNLKFEVPTGTVGRWGVIGPGLTASTVTADPVTARSFPIASSIEVGCHSSTTAVDVSAYVEIGDTAGTIGLQFALFASSATPSINLQAYSHLEFIRVQ